MSASSTFPDDYPDETVPVDIETPEAQHTDPASAMALGAVWADPDPTPFGVLRAIQNDAVAGRIMWTAFINFLVAGALALLIRVQLVVPDNTFVDPQTYNGLFTMHSSAMMYLFAVPMLEGFAIYLLPIMLGNREMPFPRLGVFSYVTFILGSLLFFSSYLLDAVPDTGWFAYVPLSGPEFSIGIALDYWLLALGVAEVAAIAAGVEIIIAVLKMRAPGMGLHRMPLYAWAMLVTAFCLLFAFTPLMVGSLLLELDRKIGTVFFDPALGGSPVLWQHLFWIFGHPEVYIQFLPATGMVAMIVPVFTRQRIIGYKAIAIAMISTGFMAFMLWVHHMFTVGVLPEIALGIFTGASILIGVPTAVQIFAYVGTIIAGKPVWKTPFYFVVGFLFTFVLGGVTGIMVGSVPFDWQAHDSYFVVAHLHYVLIGGVVFPIFAAIYYWFPKLTGKLLDERLGRWNFWLMFIGFHVAFFPQHIVGLLGMPRRVYTYPEQFGWGIYNLISTIGAFVLALGVLIFIINFFRSMRNGTESGPNPWGADSLEWALASAPVNYGFAVLPYVHSRHPLWDQEGLAAPTEKQRNLLQEFGAWPTNWRAAMITSTLDARPQEIFRVSGPSIWPVVTAFCLVTVFAAEIFVARRLALLGIVGVIVGLVGWHWPSNTPTSDAEEQAFARRHNIAVYTRGSRSVSRSAMSLLLLIMTIALATFLFAYFYIRAVNDVWPVGDLPLPSLGLALGSAAAVVAAAWLARHAAAKMLTGETRSSRIYQAAAFAAQLTTVALLVIDFRGLTFAWDTNAYGSCFWAIGVYLLALLSGGIGINLFAQVNTARGCYDSSHAVGLENHALYWYGMVLLLWTTVLAIYVSPYFV